MSHERESQFNECHTNALLETIGRRTARCSHRPERDHLTHAVGRWTVSGGTVTGAPRVEVGVLPRPDLCRLTHLPSGGTRPAATQHRRTVAERTVHLAPPVGQREQL